MPTYRVYDIVEREYVGHNYLYPYEPAANPPFIDSDEPEAFGLNYSESVWPRIQSDHPDYYMIFERSPFGEEPDDNPDGLEYRYWTVVLEGT